MTIAPAPIEAASADVVPPEPSQGESSRSLSLDERVTFVLAALQDTQGTIRALDAKAAALLVVLAVPLAIAPQAPALLPSVAGWQAYGQQGLLVIGALLWIFAVIAVVMTIKGRSNPLHGIDNESANGIFFAAGLSSVAEYRARLPITDESLENELAFEHLKLCGIRTAKMDWLKSAMICCASSLISISLSAFVIPVVTRYCVHGS